MDTKLIERCLRISSYLSFDSDLDVLAKLHAAGLITEKDRLQVLTEVGELAVETPDADWLDIKALETLFTDLERAELLDRVKLELIPHLDDTLWDWYINEQGDSAEEYYQPLVDALERYEKALADDADIRAKLGAALIKAEERRLEADHWTDEYGNPKSPPSSASGRWLTADDLSPAPVSRGDVDMRSIFDDVDG